MTEDLASWLLEQIVEDERRWGNPAFAPVTGVGLSELVMKVRAECEAKRRIIYELRAVEGYDFKPRTETYGYREALRGAAQALALPYADRPGYDENWRP